jgi:hypothetical protein
MESKEQARHKIKYNRILLDSVPRQFYRPITFGPNLEHDVPDFSSLQFLLEEFIALSATQVAIPKNSQIEQAVQYLHPTMRKAVVIVDKKNESFAKYGAILTPIQREFEIRLRRTDHQGVLALHIGRKDVSDELRHALATLFFDLRTFLIGIQNELQIQMDLNKIKRATDIVRLNIQNPEARFMLASLLGLFNTYEEHDITSIGIIPTDYRINLENFEKLVNDQIYKNMSQESHRLGFPEKLHKSKMALKQYTKQVVTKSPYKEIATISTKIITAVTNLPFEIDWLAALFKKPFMPPIITFDKAIQKAHAAWRSCDTPVTCTYQGYFPEEDFTNDASE